MAGIGEALRSTREHRGLSIDQVAQDTRISPRFLEALEAEQFHELPAPVYVRGFLRSYANYLKMDAQPLLDNLVGGDMAAPGAAAGYVRSNGRSGQNGASTPRRTDPFQRSGVVAAAGPAIPRQSREAVARKPAEDDGWAPEPVGPFTPPHEDHGYIPGSDLMEAPEYVADYEEPEEPVYTRRRTAGVLAERPPMPSEPGVPRKVLVFGGAVLAIIAFLALAVLATRDGGDGNTAANAGDGGDSTGPTPGTVIAVGGAAGTATAKAAGSVTPGASPSTTNAAGSVTGTTTPGATQTVEAGATATASSGTSTATPTATVPVPTQVPTATPTQAPPTPTATSVPVVLPEARAFGECTPTDGSYNCGPGPYRVICFAPLGFPLNSNWWVDVDRSFGSVPAGWLEFDGLLTNGQIIKAGQTDCATP